MKTKSTKKKTKKVKKINAFYSEQWIVPFNSVSHVEFLDCGYFEAYLKGSSDAIHIFELDQVDQFEKWLLK